MAPEAAGGGNWLDAISYSVRPAERDTRGRQSLTDSSRGIIMIAIDANDFVMITSRHGAHSMTQITARVPDDLATALDAAAARLNRSRANVVRQAIELYLQDFDDLSVALDRLRDPSDPVLDWDEVRRELLGSG